MGLIVVDLALANPLAEAVDEEGIGEVLAPKCGELYARLAQAAVEVEHSDQAGPLATPVGDGEDGAAMGDEAGEDMVAVLPDGLYDDEGRCGVDGGEDVHAHALAADEAVFAHRIVCVSAAKHHALLEKRRLEHVFEIRLSGPADFIGRLAQVSIGDQQDFVGRSFLGSLDLSNCVGCHGMIPRRTLVQIAREMEVEACMK